MAAVTRNRKVRRTITEAEMERLEILGRKLYDLGPEDGYLVLDSQWGKNPRLPHFTTGIVRRRHEDFVQVGTVRVNLGSGGVTIMMPIEDQPDVTA